MNEIWDRTLSLPNLPKKLTSRRNLHAHFSKFGDVKDVSVNKDNRTGMIEFASRAEAKAAKILGKSYEGKPIRILWFENTLDTIEKTLDPRSREREDILEGDNLWEDDDKECFGVDTKPAIIDENKKSAKDMISQHLKLSNIKKSSVSKTIFNDKSEDSESKVSPIKMSKSQPKLAQTKKILANKRKLLRKEGIASDKNKKKTSVVREPSHPTLTSLDQVDLKQKLALLDERDKLIRQKTVQDSNIKTAAAIKGTCPDMCPERERILRQCGHQIAVYESLPGTNEMDENRAVKEYIRSSADQEVPLPHDLRPGPVLGMTMNYLITNIINQIDDPNENKAVWYSFCWNRLRSIRKDIILQQLCDLETVTIVEQCARFHICCYDHMWGIEVSGYSDKINTNNLIDCLQTLKHLYEDLAKRNIKCPNEPEFHSYLILLKLTTGDVFWEYQQYAPEIQLSPKVQFAIAVYMAFINNMYSKYFSLVKQASYLEACLLQRHFDEVRTKALKMMLKAYSLPNRNVSLTTSFLMKCLKFDSQKNVLRFCETVEGYLDKKIEFDEDDNEDEYILTSSFLIKDKRLPIANAVVGENNPLPVYVSHQVHTSFDEDGKLRESLQSVTDESYDSYDSPLDESDVSILEVKPQPLSQSKPFKFSLSPKVTEQNVFSQSVFSRLGSFNTRQEGLISKELPKFDLTEMKSSKLEISSDDTFEADNSFYEDEHSESIRMEEDIDEDMVYDGDFNEKEKEARLEKNQDFKQFGAEKRTNFAFQQSFSSTPTVSIIPAKSLFFQGKENQSINFVQTANSPKLKSEGIFQFSLIPKPEIAKQFSFKADTGNKLPFGRSVQFQPVSSRIEGESEKENHFLMTQNEMKPNLGIEIKESQASIDRKYLERNQEREREALKKEKEILEKILLKKEEEERIKKEEIKKAEIERQKNIEKQKALEKLRKDLRERMKAKNAKKYLRTWKARVEKLKEKRADFPYLRQLSVESHLELWGKLKCIPATTVFQRAKDRQNLNTIVSQLLRNGVNDSCKYIGCELAELLAKSAARTMDMGSIRPVYWKLAMSLPWKDKSTSKYSVFYKMMRRCCKQTFYKKEDAQLGSVESAMTSLQIPVFVSVHFSYDLQSRSGLNGMDALIFVVVDGFESEKTCIERLRSLVTSQARSSELSVAVMTINGDTFDRSLKMELKELHEQSLIAYWTVSAWTTSNCLLDNLFFLAEHVSVVQDVCARSLESLVTETVDDFIYDVDRSQVYCSTLTDALESPNTAINIYNTFLTKLEDLLLSSKLEKYFNFADEFKSHIPPNECGGPELMCGKQYNKQYKSQISNKISTLKLPEFLGWPVHTNQVDFDSLAELLETYCRTQINDMEVFKQIIRKLAQEVTDPSSHLNSYSWLHIVEMWAESRLNRVFSTKERGRKMFVIYSKNDIQQMIKTQWWITLPIVSQAGRKM